MAVIKGKCKWACVTQPNTKFTPKYSIDVILDDKIYDDFKSKGYPVKVDDGGDKVVKISRKTEKADGSLNKKPVLRDRWNKDFDDLVGNGSTVIVQYSPYEWKFGSKSGLGLDLQGVQVLDLVEYGAADGDEFDAVEDELDSDFVSDEDGREESPFD